MKRLIRVFCLFLGVLILLTILTVGSCFVFKDSILQKVESNLAKKLGTEIKTADLDLDPFTHFPYFTLSLDGLELKGNRKQDFVRADYVEILVHPLSAIQEEIDISTLILKDGVIALSKQNEQWNFDFTDDKASSEGPQKGIVLSDLRLDNILLKVNDQKAEVFADLKIVDFKGSLSLSEKTILEGTLALIPQKIRVEDYLATAKEKWTVRLDISNDGEVTTIEQLDLSFSQNQLEVKGTVADRLDLTGSLAIVQKEEIQAWIPELYQSYIFNDARYDFDVSGEEDKLDGKIKVKTEDLSIDLIKRQNTLQMDGRVSAVFLNGFQDDYIFTEGSLMVSKLKIDQQNPSVDNMTGTLRVKDVELEYLDKSIRVMTDEIALDNGSCKVDKLSIILDSSDLAFSGTIDKAADTYSFLGTLQSDNIVAADFLSMMQDTSESTIKIKGAFDIEIAELINNDWQGDNINGKIIYAEDILEYEVALESFDGTIESEGIIANQEELHFLCNASFATLQIDAILDQLHNLGQDMISSDNLSGTLSGNAIFDFSFNQDLEIDKTKSHALVAVKAENGRLQGFKLLEDFSKYIDIDDLKDVQFDNMTNYFEWKGDHLVIPVMYIKNNAANFLISGYQNMENELLYYLQINASDILAKKFGKKKRKSKKKGWWNMYYLIEGDTENFEVRSEKDQVKAGLNKSLIEKEEIFDKLVTVFGYTDVLQSLEDWEDL